MKKVFVLAAVALISSSGFCYARSHYRHKVNHKVHRHYNHHRTSASTACLPRSIKAALNKVVRACGPMNVISTFRPGAVIAGTNHPSYHRWCRAADFTLPSGRAYQCAERTLMAWWPGGLSIDWARARHIHIDNGPRVRFVHGGYHRHHHRYVRHYWHVKHHHRHRHVAGR